MTKFGSRSIRGSSARTDGRNKGGASAIRQLAHAAEAGYHVIITPDGPKGPPEKIKPGVIQLGAITGRTIVPLGVAASRIIRISTWDKTMIPMPFTQIVASYGKFLTVPRTGDSIELESHREELERRLHAANAHAQESLKTGAD
jgi:lysophospholipid acyltransferase (LPLAT)-like uncharacterized protein